ncbi:MAG: tyrosine-type recombinase/integrase [Floccifex porci]|uniref:tyrosine-type recombinase/integrase n=1 Tax=Floccifex porci TaxID=2606629 RepID=UPI003F06FBF3
MKNNIIEEKNIIEFNNYLIEDEKSKATIEKYIRDIKTFYKFIQNQPVTKEIVMSYKKYLRDQGYAVRSINSMLASFNSFLDYFQLSNCKVKCLKLQKEVFCSQDKELSKEEYIRLLEASKQNQQIHLIMQTICSTGIRVSELEHFTIESIKQGEVNINCKGKIRKVLIPLKLKKLLLKYAKKQKIENGVLFRDKKGNSMNRTVIWEQMKKVCKEANVNPKKVYPHNLRKLFARSFYKSEKDIAKLADILGHSSIDTTRIYIISTGSEHRKKIEQLVFNEKEISLT